MSINILKLSKLSNITMELGIPAYILSPEELRIAVGLWEGTVSVPTMRYIGIEADLCNPFYCKDCEVDVSSGTSLAYAYFQVEEGREWIEAPVISLDGRFYISFNNTLPDHAQLIYRFRFIYGNLSALSTLINLRLNTVDYPIDFDYYEFSVAASSHENAPLSVTNNSVQGTAQDIHVLPIYSGNYLRDSVYVLTASGKTDTNKYHLQRGYRFPEDSGWDFGRVSISGSTPQLHIESSSLTLSGTSISGTWTSPVMYIPDDDYITLYVYGEGLENVTIEARASDTSPQPNFLISSWTQRLYTDVGQQSEISLPARRPETIGYQEAPSLDSIFWAPGLAGRCGDMAIVSACPFIIGRSKRMYVKGDGTVLAEAPIEGQPDTLWEYGHRGYDTGLPYRECGDINSFWNAGHLISLMGQWSTTQNGACTVGRASADRKWYRMTYATEEDSTNWALGKYAGDKLVRQYPYVGHFNDYYFGVAQEPVYSEPLGSYTLAVDRHPNEWLSIAGVLYPWWSAGKFMCIYYTHIRNFWTVESKLLGVFGAGDTPCDEGWAVCKSKSDNGFWLHVGYMSRLINKYSLDGDFINTTEVSYGFNALVNTQNPAGLWAIRNDAVYWYSENDDGTLTETFSIEDDAFIYLQAGDVDEYNNLWLVDRDTSIVYRINFTSRAIDYAKPIPYTVAVWPHPRDGTAYLYTSFNPGTFSTAISRIDQADSYGYVDLITALPELPLSDYSGVQFKGKAVESSMEPAINDPVWGTADSVTLGWEAYVNASLTLPKGKYKQFRLTLKRDSGSDSSPSVNKVRIPQSLVLSDVAYQESRPFYINPHLRYNREFGHFNSELCAWWSH